LAFEPTIIQNEYVLVAFVSPECPHCHALHPEYEMAA
jgi:thiol-disulfide isomerase/thioredoxin